MSKSRKSNTPKIGMKDIDPRYMRVNQRAHRFTDRKKEERRNACRKGRWAA